MKLSLCTSSLLLMLLLVAECTTPLLAQAPLTKIWDKTYGGTGSEGIAAMLPTPDGGYILAGSSTSGVSGDKTEPNRGKSDYWVVKINENGSKVWDRTYGGNGEDVLRDIIATPDGGYLLAGTSASYAGHDKTENSKGREDYWVVKLSVDGNKQWDKTYGGNSLDELRAVVTTADGGYLLAGRSPSKGAMAVL